MKCLGAFFDELHKTFDCFLLAASILATHSNWFCIVKACLAWNRWLLAGTFPFRYWAKSLCRIFCHRHPCRIFWKFRRKLRHQLCSPKSWECSWIPWARSCRSSRCWGPWMPSWVFSTGTWSCLGSWLPCLPPAEPRPPTSCHHP